MKISYTLLFIVLITFSAKSQSKLPDSVLTRISVIKNDSLRTLEYQKLINLYRKSNPDLHFSIVKLHLKELAQDSLKSNYGKLLRELGINYRKQGQLDSSLAYYKKASVIFLKNNDSLNIAKIQSSLANVLKAKGDYPAAITNIKKSIKFFQNFEDKIPQAIVVNKVNLGGIYVSLKDWKNADKFFFEAYSHPFTQNNKSVLSTVSINLAITKNELGLLDEALKYAKQAEQIEKRLTSLANLYNNIGNIYEKKENFKEANNYYQKSLELYRKNNNQNGIIKSFNNLGNNATKWGKYKLAEAYLLKANSLLNEVDNLGSLRYNYEMLTTLYNKKQDYKKSIYYSYLEQKIQDSLFSLDKQKAIAEFEVAYKTEKTEREKNIAKQQLEITRLESIKNRNLFYSALIIASLLILASLFYYSRFKAQKKAEIVTLELKEVQKRLALEKQYKDSELKALKAQMNPHFIFNALNSIQDYIVLNQKDLASDYLGKFADLIRNYLHFSDTGFISIPEEVHNLKLYLELEKLRFEDALDYSFNVDSTANSEGTKIPTMLIQPYVENALKHGLLHKKDNRNLTISISKSSKNIIECVVEDNGIGREKSKAINQKRQILHKSFALKATTERLDLLNYGKEKKIGVKIIDLKENNKAIGTKVVLKIPTIKR
ncbi:Tetratricopeptide repeat-containing protein [Bizionia echini]|uniref:Tetratricopeptide repeat-containing protein n=1 Tax=Bizionia echini TaxID=649333 RepID=A0A1I5CVR4_9FLAO|nr:tetratricopeptide repeat protein [Bizionia echini]SFN91049.1 Tetratricopeptide repeat-containing protein [Bizionia echini]